MGLPNASLSQCRHVEVVSWTSRRSARRCWLDVDEIIAGQMREIPRPEPAAVPPNCGSPSGTVVTWRMCDRLDNIRVSTIERKISSAVSRMFRYYIWGGIAITINGARVQGIDPTYLNKKSPLHGGALWGKPRRIRVRADPNGSGTGLVTIIFSRLPVLEWSGLTNDQKRSRGIANGAGVSIVRAGREIEYGWHFMGSKRRENYDDWWRCEISFDPILDEAFGITHTKQQIRPRAHLLEALTGEVESSAKALNSAVRKQFQELKLASHRDPLEQSLLQIEPKLPPIGRRRHDEASALDLSALRDRHSLLRLEAPPTNGKASEYRIIEDCQNSRSLFDVHADDGRVIVVMNNRHPFFKKELAGYADHATLPMEHVRSMFERLIVSAARAELTLSRSADIRVLKTYRDTWGHALALLTHG